jgi:hypothetical protein
MELASGIVALFACAFQVGWFIFCAYGALAGNFGNHGTDTPFVGVGGLIFLGWPTLAFGLSCYSIYVAGVSLRNALGVLAFILSGTVVGICVVQSLH